MTIYVYVNGEVPGSGPGTGATVTTALTDVSDSPASDGQVLLFVGGQYQPHTLTAGDVGAASISITDALASDIEALSGGGGATTLAGLTDVSDTTPADGALLVYQAAASTPGSNTHLEVAVQANRPQSDFTLTNGQTVTVLRDGTPVTYTYSGPTTLVGSSHFPQPTFYDGAGGSFILDSGGQFYMGLHFSPADFTLLEVNGDAYLQTLGFGASQSLNNAGSSTPAQWVPVEFSALPAVQALVARIEALES